MSTPRPGFNKVVVNPPLTRTGLVHHELGCNRRNLQHIDDATGWDECLTCLTVQAVQRALGIR